MVTSFASRQTEIGNIRMRFAESHFRNFSRQEHKLDKYIDQPEFLIDFLGRLTKTLQRASAYPELAERIIKIVHKLDDKPIQYGYTTEWEQNVRYAEELCYSTGLTHYVPQFLNIQAHILFEKGEHTKSIAQCSQSIELSLKNKQDRQVIQGIEQAINNYNALNDFNGAFSFLKQFEDWLEQNQAEPEIMIRYNLIKTLIYRRQGLLQNARTTIEHTIQILQDNVAKFDHIFRANTYHMRAIIRWIGGDYDLAEEDYGVVINLLEEAHAKKAQAGAMCDLGLLYWSAGQLHKAEYWIKKSVAQAHEQNDQYRLVMLIGNLGLVHLSQGKLHLAKHNMEEQFERAIQQGFKREIIRATGNLGAVQLYLREYGEALENTLTNIAAFSVEHEGIANSYVTASRCYAKLGQLELAHEYVERALVIANNNGYEAVQIGALRALAEITPLPEKIEMLEKALEQARRLSKFHEADCYLQLAYWSSDENEKQSLWQKGEDLLREIGADAWLDTFDETEPPFLATLT